MTALAIEMKQHRGPRRWQSEGKPSLPPDMPSHVVPVIVDNPNPHGPVKVEAFRSTKDDILGYLHARKEIDEAQYHAGRRYEMHVEKSQIGSVKAMDPTKEPVDGGGGFPDPISDRQVAAVRELSEAARVLGRKGEVLVRQVLVERLRFKEISVTGDRADLAYVRRRFFDCLEELAILWNLAGR